MSAEPLCWCCASWGLYRPATTAAGTCDRCDKSSPSACKDRHYAEALKAGKDQDQ